MSFNQLTCGQNQGNTGVPNCVEDYGAIRKIILMPKTESFATETLAKTLSSWTTNINKASTDRTRPLPIIFDYEDLSEEPVYEEGIGTEEFVRNGKKTWRLRMDAISQGLTKVIKGLSQGSYGFMAVTENGYIWAKTDDDTIVSPFEISSFTVENQTLPTADAKQRSAIRLSFTNSDDWDTKGVAIEVTAFDPVEDLNGILDCEVYESVSTTASLIIGVRGLYDSRQITGLVQADFTFSTTLNSEIASVTDNSDGTYTLVPTTTISSGASTAVLAGQPSMTTKGYESPSTLSFTIV